MRILVLLLLSLSGLACEKNIHEARTPSRAGPVATLSHDG